MAATPRSDALPETPAWTAEMLIDELGLARATVYRYIKELRQVGLIAPASGGSYVLGPRFIEFDRQIRLADPLLQIGPPVMAGIRKAVNGAQLLCSFYGDRVLTIHLDQSDESINSPMERGRPFPLFHGAPSRIILAHLPNSQLRGIFLHSSREIADAGLGDTWTEFRDRLKQIRARGFYVGSEITPTLVGVAAPIFRADDVVVGCLCVVRQRRAITGDDIEFLSRVATDGAQRISQDLRELDARTASATVPSFRTLRAV